MAGEEELTYLIPRNVSARFEFMPGVGWAEIRRLIPWVAAAVVLGVMPYGVLLAGHPTLAAALHLVFPVAGLAVGVVGTILPVADGLTIAQQIALRRRHIRRQRIYRYERGG